MRKGEVSRRKILTSVGLAAGASLLAGCEDTLQGSPPQAKAATSESNKPGSRDITVGTAAWQYVKLDPAEAAAQAYRLMSEGGCMYGVFAGILSLLARSHGEPFRSFPVHMMKYGEGGVGLWGSLCGTLNGGAAIIGLFERDKQRRESLIAELFSWYERTALPNYRPKQKDAQASSRSVAGSVLCHVSVGKWCKASGEEMGSPEMKERCRRLTADVAAKVVELLNGHLQTPCKFAGLSPEVNSCLSCHGKERKDTLSKMQCGSCHQQLSTKHPAIPALPSKDNK
jgi:hypothetical protein